MDYGTGASSVQGEVLERQLRLVLAYPSVPAYRGVRKDGTSNGRASNTVRSIGLVETRNIANLRHFESLGVPAHNPLESLPMG